jgi:hypothetical protein
MEIRQNYENYQRVKDAFKEFIHALVWESVEVECGASEEEINEHIDKYCKNNGGQMIALTNDSVSKFIRSLYERYKVTYYEHIGKCGIAVKAVDTIKTDNMELALQKAAKFYRNGVKPYVEVFDNETKKYILKLD